MNNLNAKFKKNDLVYNPDFKQMFIVLEFKNECPFGYKKIGRFSHYSIFSFGRKEIIRYEKNYLEHAYSKVEHK